MDKRRITVLRTFTRRANMPKNELGIYLRASKVVDLIDIAYSENSLNDAKVSKISRLLGEVEFCLTGERRGRK